jgi:hypothetical protein
MKYKIAVVVILCCAATSTIQTPSHCAASETVIFSCRIKGSPKVLSLCGSKNLTKDVGYLQYRFGRPGKVELQFPEEKQNSQAQFLFEHYFRAQVDRTAVKFKNGGYEYSIYDAYEGEEAPARNYRGVSIEYIGSEGDSADANKGGENRDLECTGRVISRLNKLENVIPCNKDDSLFGCP